MKGITADFSGLSGFIGEGLYEKGLGEVKASVTNKKQVTLYLLVYFLTILLLL